MAMSNLSTRLATAAVGVPLLLLLLFAGPPWGLLLLLLAAAAVAAHELYAMTHPGERIAPLVGTAMTWAMMLAVWFFPAERRAVLAVALLIPFVGIAVTLARLGDIRTAALRTATQSFGPLYIGAGLGALALVRKLDADEGAALVVLCLALAWASDTGAYFMGRFLGKHKLYPAVSPKKTWEGVLGGVLGAVVSAVVAKLLFLPSVPLGHAAALGAVGSVAGQIGDLGESLFKRSVGVKDSGGIVPGHGGILDRIDALLVTSPLVLLYLLWR